jgi:hypothetical protein
MAAVFELRFRNSSSCYYRDAIRLAKALPHHEEITEARRTEHICRFGTSASELAALLELWDLVRGWRSTRLLINGLAVRPRQRWAMLQILECAGQAARFTPPQRYCCSAPMKESGAWPGRPHFPCRHLVLRGFGYLLDERVEWHEAERRVVQLQALLLERGVALCPFLNLFPFLRALEEWKPQGPGDPDLSASLPTEDVS